MAGLPNLPYPDLIDSIRDLLLPEQKLYLIGGAVRDMLLNRQTHDLDFITCGNVRRLGRQVADLVGGAFYMLDDQRDTARIICPESGNLPKIIDVALIRSDSLEGDLRSRDFTINAMAIDLERPEDLIDPLGGAIDLRKNRLRTCSHSSFLDDPLRILRSVRLAHELKLQIDETIPDSIQQALPGLGNVSAERLRDELFRILDGKNVHTGIRLLQRLGVIGAILPELEIMANQIQAGANIQDGWGHIIEPLRNLETLFVALQGGGIEKNDDTDNMLVLAYDALSHYGENIGSYLNSSLAGDRTRKSLLLFACLYLEFTRRRINPIAVVGENNFISKLNNGKDIIRRSARASALSVVEGEYLESVVTQSMDFHHLLKGKTAPSRRDIYQYFRLTGEAGIGICFISLADSLTNVENTITLEKWLVELKVCERLFKAWWIEPRDIICPPRLLSGDDLQVQFGLSPGPQIGELLEAIREAQASGEVIDRKGAIRFASEWLSKGS